MVGEIEDDEMKEKNGCLNRICLLSLANFKIFINSLDFNRNFRDLYYVPPPPTSLTSLSTSTPFSFSIIFEVEIKIKRKSLKL